MAACQEEHQKHVQKCFSVAFRCKRLPVPRCAPVQWVKQTFYSGTQTAEAESFSPVLGESQTQGDPAFL